MLSAREIRFLIRCTYDRLDDDDLPGPGSGCQLSEEEIRNLIKKLEIRAESAGHMYDGIFDEDL